MLAVLCVSLIGSGVRGLQTAALLSATPVAWFPDHPWLQTYFGLYPVAEALALQASVTVAFSLSLFWLAAKPLLKSRVPYRPSSS
jgi:high-affinity iron transporter